jgi:hypothetical protein
MIWAWSSRHRDRERSIRSHPSLRDERDRRRPHQRHDAAIAEGDAKDDAYEDVVVYPAESSDDT